MTTEISTQRAGGLALASFDDAFRFSKMVAASEFAPKDFRGKPESCMLAIQHGSEVGLSPMQSLQSIAVINGRPTIWGDAALALVQSSPVCEYVREYTEGEGDALVAVCEAKRRGYPAPATKATEEDLQKSRLSVNRTSDLGVLNVMRSKVDERLKAGFYTPAQADELLNLIAGKIEFLTVEPEDSGTDLAHESAEHEVQA
jgi:hypothetical protein